MLTTLDLMDRGTNAYEVLQGRVIPVKLGIIGLVNRSQEDINNNKSIDDARRYELEYLAKNYPGLDRQNGSSYLTKRLSDILMKHIAQCLPALRKRIVSLAAEHRANLKIYGETLNKVRMKIRKTSENEANHFSPFFLKRTGRTEPEGKGLIELLIETE